METHEIFQAPSSVVKQTGSLAPGCRTFRCFTSQCVLAVLLPCNEHRRQLSLRGETFILWTPLGLCEPEPGMRIISEGVMSDMSGIRLVRNHYFK